MPKYPKITENDDGWSDWINPKMEGYKMSCCDCNLVHSMEFMIVKITKHLPDGGYEWKELDPEKHRVMFRASRNNRATAAMRRKRK